MSPLSALIAALLSAQLQIAQIQLVDVASAQALPTSTPALVLYVQSLDGLNSSFFDTLKCESQLNPNAIGDDGTSFGVAQIHLPAHPDITKTEALDQNFAVEWAAQQFLDGNQHIFSCYDNLYGRPATQ